jgi:hypothetical protein
MAQKLCRKGQAVQRVNQQYTNHISEADITLRFAKGKKAANIARKLQIGLLVETIFGLGLLRKTENVPFIRHRKIKFHFLQPFPNHLRFHIVQAVLVHSAHTGIYHFGKYCSIH